MRYASLSSRLAIAATASALAVACVAPTGGEATDVSSSAIVNGTPVNLGANSFVRLGTTGCSGTLLENDWALVAAHCAPRVGDSVMLDSQSSIVARVVTDPVADVALLHLASPFAVGGSTLGFSRVLRTTLAQVGSHIRCYAYGKTTSGAAGIDTQLRYEEIYVSSTANGTYAFSANALHQSETTGDAGGGCLDDTGAAIGVLEGTTLGNYAIASSSYASWADAVLLGECTYGSDCTTGICNARTHECVTSTCDDGARDDGESGVDCGGPCAKSCCAPTQRDCGDGTCVTPPQVCK